MKQNDRPEATVDFWAAIEALSPATIKIDTGPSPIQPMRSPFPWTEGETPGEPVEPTGRRIYLAAFDVSRTEEALAARFPTTSYEERRDRGLAVAASFVVDHAGIPLATSFRLSSFPWAFGQLLRGDQCHGFGAEQRGAFGTFEAWREECAGRPLDPQDLAMLRQLIDVWTSPIHEFVVHELLACSVKAPTDEPPINSFYLDDLLRVRTNRSPLLDYILRADEVPMEDSLATPHALINQLEPARLGRGSWPGSHNLSLHQQAAVAQMTDWNERPVVGVNGPPGTGKTTLVKELVANVVTERARHLARYVDPHHAFVHQIATSDRNGQARKISTLADHLTGFEMVLACTANAAAANVTRELPLAAAIDGGPHWQYLAPTATTVLNEPAWGLVAAQLGSKQNTRDFLRGFQRDTDANFNKSVKAVEVSWAKARQDFLAAAENIDRLLAIAQQAFGVSQAADLSQGQLEDAERRLASSGSLSRWWRRIDRSHRARRVQAAETRLTPWRDEFGPMLPTATRVQGVDGALGSAWLTPEFVRAQQELFRLALQLHAAFHRATWRAAQLDNWWLFCDLLAGDAPHLNRSAKNALWRWFFLVVPLVSSTFASVPRLLRDIDGLGLAIVDEAGQVPPSALAGLADRCQRLVALGDPSQLEPVMTVPLGVRRHLRSLYAPAPIHSEDSSVQRIADELCPIGTQRDGHRIGCPLVVHRRCAEPMFSIANELAYDGQMVHGPPASLQSRSPAVDSRWIDVAGCIAEGNWIPEEGAAFLTCLRQLPKGTDYFVITPFRDVVDGVVELDRTHRLRLKAANRVGTVHTFQGREADGVILVLGGGSAGARSWAGDRPNLANVAITRAKKFLWVIGDRAAWSETASFALINRVLSSTVQEEPGSGSRRV